MAEYNMQELNLPGEDGKRILYPRMKLYGQVDLETITEKIAYASSFTRGDIIGLVQAITDEIAYQMGQGYSVKIDNLGVFTPALGLRQDSGHPGGGASDPRQELPPDCPRAGCGQERCPTLGEARHSCYEKIFEKSSVSGAPFARFLSLVYER